VDKLLFEAKDLFEEADEASDPALAVQKYGQSVLRANMALKVAKDAAGYKTSHMELIQTIPFAS
jgi:hypothetical protein